MKTIKICYKVIILNDNINIIKFIKWNNFVYKF